MSVLPQHLFRLPEASTFKKPILILTSVSLAFDFVLTAISFFLGWNQVDRSACFFPFLKSSNPVVLLQLVDLFVGYCAPHFEQYFAFARQDFAPQLLQNMAASEELRGAITQSWSSGSSHFSCLLPFCFALPFSFFICVLLFCLRFAFLFTFSFFCLRFFFNSRFFFFGLRFLF